MDSLCLVASFENLLVKHFLADQNFYSSQLMISFNRKIISSECLRGFSRMKEQKEERKTGKDLNSVDYLRISISTDKNDAGVFVSSYFDTFSSVLLVQMRFPS